MAGEYPFPFSEATLRRFAREEEGARIWETLGEDWTPESDEPLHIHCLRAWLSCVREGILDSIRGWASKIPIGTKHHDDMKRFDDAMRKCLGMLHEIIDLARFTIPSDPVVRRLVDEAPDDLAPAPLTVHVCVQGEGEPGKEYPFPVPEETFKTLTAAQHSALPIGDRWCPGWSPDSEIPLFFVNLGIWKRGLRNLVHESADHRIATLPPGSDHHIDIVYLTEIIDKYLDLHEHMAFEGFATLKHDPVVCEMFSNADQGAAHMPNEREEAGT